jgi:hypothetical protein
MGSSRLADFFLNNPAGAGEGGEAAGPIVAPAFSITKVLAAGSVVLGPLAAVVTKTLEGKDFDLTSGQVVAFVIAVLATLAILGAADVLARGIATRSDAMMRAAELQADAMTKVRESADFHKFDPPLRAVLESDPMHPEILVVAVGGGAMAHFLVMGPNGAGWVQAKDVRISGAVLQTLPAFSNGHVSVGTAA